MNDIGIILNLLVIQAYKNVKKEITIIVINIVNKSSFLNLGMNHQMIPAIIPITPAKHIIRPSGCPPGRKQDAIPPIKVITPPTINNT